MLVVENITDVRRQVNKWKRQGLTIAFVPTMGALHEGHASLVATAAHDCDRVVASIFVNPTQFASGEDLDSYPRDFERDCQILEKMGCNMVFHPSVEEMYPEGFATYVDLESDMTKQLCGKSRATHFKGVCTVVSKLFHIVMPHRAYFGEKDAQQLAVIRKMVRDQAFFVEVMGCPTVREEDGLAMSSRNAYLNEEERKAAGVLYQAIVAAKEYISEKSTACTSAEAVSSAEASAGDTDIAASDVIALMRQTIEKEPLARIEYIDVVDGKTLMPTEHIAPGTLVAMAVHIGKTRLIDNFTV